MTNPLTDSVEHLLQEWQRERPELDPSPIGVQGRIVRLSAHFLRAAEDYLGPLDLGWEAFSLIVTLRRSGKPYEMRPTDILRESLLTSGAVTNRIDRVERLGLVERRPDTEDRRSYVIRLTPAGKKLADKAIANHIDAVGGLLDVLSAKEQAQLAGLLSKLLGAFEKKAKPKARGRGRSAAEV
ncbi:MULTISPECIES: MarR family transcriptional regulator [unclassified Beijerinckia]|uniref:MarR family winged helix-turn-helix transcriptional regulator n=1 Tax=unclassified Beijerinckia TaxID=2638183 RepID=UPI00089543D5|nr:MULTISPECIES: MarR family transcriptional regulator [unclassified Beijerinckia]MDH7798369.1 DNA-binding MarR family transcriptional regulator [Beijerinckia sp. GAS462]SED18626.1 transcriptional regulator, MarR family [Beijerinckia sp. 28-YEA-48]